MGGSVHSKNYLLLSFLIKKTLQVPGCDSCPALLLREGKVEPDTPGSGIFGNQ